MKKQTAIFSICSNNYLSQADVFYQSARAAHPEADLYLGLADEPMEDGSALPGVRVVPARQLNIPDFHSVAFGYDIMEFNTAIKPFIFLRLFEQGYDNVLYFDPDIVIFRRLDSIFDALDGGASFVLTPHLCVPPGIDAPRSEVDIMRTGIYNLGFLACSQQPETEPILHWWARKLRYECLNDQTGGIFVDQKFMDLVPGFTEQTCILRDSAMNVAYWNLAQRTIAKEPDGWSVDGKPLGFFHFSGFNPHDPTRLSKHIAPRPVSASLQNLLQFYADRLLKKGDRESHPYAYGRFASGIPIPDVVRRMFREKHPNWPGDPFKTYDDFLRRPAPGAARGRSGEIVTNLMEYIHQRSDGLKGEFDLSERNHVASFSRWFREHTSEFGISESLARPV